MENNNLKFPKQVDQKVTVFIDNLRTNLLDDVNEVRSKVNFHSLVDLLKNFENKWKQDISGPMENELYNGSINFYTDFTFYFTLTVILVLTFLILSNLVGISAGLCCPNTWDRRKILKFSVILAWILSSILAIFCFIIFFSGGLFYSTCGKFQDPTRDIIEQFAPGKVKASTQYEKNVDELTMLEFQNSCRENKSLFEIFDMDKESVTGWEGQKWPKKRRLLPDF